MRIGVVALTLAAMAGGAEAARVGVLSNRYAGEAAADLGSRLAGHTFTGVDVSVATPTLASLTAAYDVLLVFADQNFSTAPAVGDAAAAFANAGHAVVLGTFYDQQRSDAGGSSWGALETIDPNTTDGLGVPDLPTPGGQSRTLNSATLVNHPLTQQVASLYGTQWAGGNEAKPGTIVVALWQQPNARGKPDPAIAYRVTGTACVIQLGIAPHYAALGALGVNYGGDFYRAWQNAFDFAAVGCARGVLARDPPPPVPTLSELALAALALALAGLAFVERRRLAARR
jgi:hypothetical protein